MPIDSGIALGVQPVKLVNPMEVMQTIQQTRAARSENEQRQFALTEARQKAQEDDEYKQAIQSSAGMTPDAFLEHVRTNAPEHYLAVQKAIQDANQKAVAAKKSTAEAASAASQAALHQQQYIGHVADQLFQSDLNPALVNVALNDVVQHFPEWKDHAEQIRQVAATQGKDALKSVLQTLIPAGDTKSRAEAANAAAELPGKTATSAIQTQVAAGTVGGMTPDQQQQARDRATNARIAAQNAATAAAAQREAARHNGATEAMQDPTNPKRQDALEQQYRGILQKEISSRSGGLGTEDQKVNQAVHLMALMDQNRDPKTGAYNIPKAQFAELANGLATLVSPNGRPTDSMRTEIETRTAKGDMNGLLTYLTGTPFNGSTQDMFKMLRDSITRQGKVAQDNREQYFTAIKAMAPTDLAAERRAKLEQSLKLNSMPGGAVTVTDPKGGIHNFATQAQADAFKKAAGIQ